jgi:hypothetical protein
VKEQYATLGANVVVELYSEGHARQPTTRAWAIFRRADRNHRLADQRTSRPTAATPTEPTAPAGPSNPRSGRWWPIPR